MENLSFKFGQFTDLPNQAILGSNGQRQYINKKLLLNNNKSVISGNLCFSKINNSYGMLTLKHDDQLLHVMPPPGLSGFPLVGQGYNNPSIYSSNITLSQINFISKNLNQNTEDNYVSVTFSSENPYEPNKFYYYDEKLKLFQLDSSEQNDKDRKYYTLETLSNSVISTGSWTYGHNSSNNTDYVTFRVGNSTRVTVYDRYIPDPWPETKPTNQTFYIYVLGKNDYQEYTGQWPMFVSSQEEKEQLQLSDPTIVTTLDVTLHTKSYQYLQPCRGILQLYHTNGARTEIRQGDTEVWHQGYFYLPGGPNSQYARAIWKNNSSAFGTGKELIYVDQHGQIKVSTSTVGSSTTPVYLNEGKLTSCASYSPSVAVNDDNQITVTVGGVTSDPDTVVKAVTLSLSQEKDNETTHINPHFVVTVNGVSSNAEPIPYASSTNSGFVSTLEQTFSGEKTFSSMVTSGLKLDTTEIKNQDGTKKVLFYFPKNAAIDNSTLTAYAAWVRSPSAEVGGSSLPVYVSTNGELTPCTTYAGGTAVTLNNNSKGGSTAAFFAPTSSGESGQLLISGGSGSAPQWINSATFRATLDGGGNTITDYYVSNTTFKAEQDLRDSYRAADLQVIDNALAEAKAYTDETKVSILGSGQLNATYDTLQEIAAWIEGDGVNATELTNAIAEEAQLREAGDAAVQAYVNGLNVSGSNGISVSGNFSNGFTISGVNATESVAGIVSAVDQKFGGDKTFTDDVTIQGTTTLGDNYVDTITLKGKTVLTNGVQYGTPAPSSLVNPAPGQIYFQII